MDEYTNDAPAVPVGEAVNGSIDLAAPESADGALDGAQPGSNGTTSTGEPNAADRSPDEFPSSEADAPDMQPASVDAADPDGTGEEATEAPDVATEAPSARTEESDAARFDAVVESAIGPGDVVAAEEAAPEAETPEAEGPEAETPEAEGEAPEAEGPEAETPEAEAPEAEAAWLEAEVPEAEIAGAEVPEVETREPAAFEAGAPAGAAELEVESGAPGEETAPPSAEPVSAPVPATVARYLAAALHAAGVKFAFTVPGESFLPLLDALPDTGVKVVATRHEAGAAFMAEAYGQLTGRPAAVLVTRAVGAANASIGIHTARQNSTPLFVIVGQVARSLRGREAFQEADIVDSFGRLAKWAVEVDRAAALPAALEEGVRRALSGRPGPVIFSIPEDVFEESTVDAVPPVARRLGAAAPDPTAVRVVLRMLTDARRPVILAGGGVLRARATSDLVKLAEILEVPVVAAWRRQDVFPNDHRLYLGVTGYGAPDTVRERLTGADAVLVIGCRLNEIASFDYAFPSPTQRWAHVDLEPRRAVPGLPEPQTAIAADARAFLRAARERLAGAVHLAETLDDRRTANAADRAAFEESATVDGGPWDGPGVHPGRVVATLRDVLPPDAILTTDAGNFSGWAARGYRFRRPGTFLGPTSGAMGYGLPAAISAALVHRDRPVVALTGDGGFAMTMSELETAVRERSRVIAIVFDNERYGMIRSYQDRRPDARTLATDLGPIDFGAVARAAGANGVLVEDDASFEPALREALAADRPTVLHLRLDRRWGPVSEAPVD